MGKNMLHMSKRYLIQKGKQECIQVSRSLFLEKRQGAFIEQGSFIGAGTFTVFL